MQHPGTDRTPTDSIAANRARVLARLRHAESPDPETPSAAPRAALGRLTKSVDTPATEAPEKDPRETRRRRFAQQRTAAAILPRERVARCLWTVASISTGAQVWRREDRCRLGGLQVCASVWTCPVCSARISETRRRELNRALEWARAEGLVPVLLTLTARHGVADELAPLLGGMKDAKRWLRQSRAWRAVKPSIAGTITATELTHGANGWHPHFHELLLLRAGDEAEAVALVETLRAEWLRCLGRAGLSGAGAAFDAQGAQAAGQYVAKWGAAEELALAARKTGAGRHPIELLTAAGAGDDHAAALFAVYAAAFRGRRQLTWSPGLKAAAGLDEVPDDQAADAELIEGQASAEAEELLALIYTPDWRALMRGGVSRAAILTAGETGGREGLAAFLAAALARLRREAPG